MKHWIEYVDDDGTELGGLIATGDTFDEALATALDEGRDPGGSSTGFPIPDTPSTRALIKQIGAAIIGGLFQPDYVDDTHLIVWMNYQRTECVRRIKEALGRQKAQEEAEA